MASIPQKPVQNGTSSLIVGGGTIGISIALHLSDRGYKNITVLDRGEDIPSAYSAGNDVNKIVRADYEDAFYATHALNAIHTWRTSPIFSPYYHHTGYLVASSSSAPLKATSHISRLMTAISSHPNQPRGCLSTISRPTDVRRKVPQLTGLLTGWSGYFNSHAGYARAAPALKALYIELLARGVTFHLGSAGEAVAILPDEETAKSFPAPRPYIKTADKKLHCADVIILALGAHTARLLPAAGAQLTAKSWAVGHVRVSAGEAARLKGMPVVNCRDLGFFFEPVSVDESEQEWLIKLCAHGGGYTNRLGASGSTTSLPPSQVQENDAIPVEDEALIRRLLREALPEFAKRPLERRFMCWCTDTADSEYVIDFVPGFKGLVLAGGDSGHAFKMFPIFGGWVADVIEKGAQDEERWRWKVGSSDGKEEIGWRVGGVKDISEVRSRL
ncbi:FAD dependent oxidoreductase [Lentithecium fluviatile CBS 122367]|uniref:FAD dependent oxidoreductase n=1 Tax=Lentithecium fluviatile CBS 122367 TaxID=1168545 RepID=A0A6G1IMC4_9PLEO|nr:FAD dependent oxidoreductase [Lentithecium fluviatile CBS 122367]